MRFVIPLLFSLLPLKGAALSGVSLPVGVSAYAMQQDEAGNLYVAGSAAPSQPGAKAAQSDVYVAKLSPDGATVIWSATFGGSDADSAAGLAINAAGSVYVTGSTSSADFPVSASAVQTNSQAASQAFLAVLDAQGSLQNATYLGGAAAAQGYAVALTSAGQPIVAGFGGAGLTPPANAPSFNSGSFLIELDAAMAHVLFASTVGGQYLALDAAGNIYVAGASYAGQAGPMMPGAFQTTINLNGCGGTVFVGFACSYQYVAKVNATAANLVYATYIAGRYGAQPAGLSVDSQGNAIVAGSTFSADYPTSVGSFEPVDIASAPAPPQSPSSAHTQVFPPPQTGYVTKLNARGSGLVFSTFLGGTGTDAVTNFAVGDDAYIYLAGFAKSSDFPGLEGDPAACFPEFFLARLTADGSAIGHTAVFSPNVLCPGCAASTNAALLMLSNRNSPVLLAGSRMLAIVDLSATGSPVACLLDAADLQPVSAVAPGQLVSLFGRHLAAGEGVAAQPTGGTYPVSLNLTAVNVNGAPAPLLYSSQQQLDLQIPYETAGNPLAQIQYAGSSQTIFASRRGG